MAGVRLVVPVVLAIAVFSGCDSADEKLVVPPPHPSDRVLTFAAERDDASDIYALDLPSGQLRLLVSNGADPIWSPDGSVLAFQRGDDVYLRRSNQNYPHRIARRSSVGSWSPDGRSLLLDGLWRVDIDGGRRDRVLAGGGIEPTLSPGGGRIAFRRGESFDPRELWVANADGSQAHRLAAVDTCSTPTWSPGGMKIVVVDPTGARSAYGGYLHVVDVVSGRSKRLLRREVTCDRPRWSPDGRRVAVTVDLPDDIAPLIVTLHTPTQRVIKSARGGHPYAWSPTGRSLVVGGSEGGLMLVEARSGRVRRPTTAARYGYDITGAAWHPGRMRAGGLGGVAARFGTVASDSTASGNTLVTKHRLADIAADGTNIVLLYADIANCVESWNPVQKKLVRFDEDSCLGIDNQAVDTVAAAGARSAWIDSMETLHYDLSVLTATARVPSPSIVFSEQDALGQGGLAGTGKLLVYVRRRAHTSQIVRLGPPNRVLGTEPGTASLLDVAPDRIAVEASGQTKILDGAGSVLAHIPSTATAAEVDGDVVAILRGRNLHLYDIRSSNTVARLTLPAGGRLLGLARGVIAYGEPGRIVLMRFSDRRRAAFAVPPGPDVNARLTNAGLFYSFPAGSGTHVIFRPFATIDKSLG